MPEIPVLSTGLGPRTVPSKCILLAGDCEVDGLPRSTRGTGSEQPPALLQTNSHSAQNVACFFPRKLQEALCVFQWLLSAGRLGPGREPQCLTLSALGRLPPRLSVCLSLLML